MESQGIDPSGGLKPPAFRKLRSTTEFVAIAFTTASFQNLRVKRCEVRRSPRKRKKWRKTVARSSPKGKSPVLDSSRCPKIRRFNEMACSLELPRTGLLARVVESLFGGITSGWPVIREERLTDLNEPAR